MLVTLLWCCAEKHMHRVAINLRTLCTHSQHGDPVSSCLSSQAANKRPFQGLFRAIVLVLFFFLHCLAFRWGILLFKLAPECIC